MTLTGAMLECQKAIIKLRKHPYAWPFNQPVDPVALNIPTYFDIIKHPMDLGTIQEKLETEKYSNPEEFIQDVELVWNNCYTFNHPSHDISKMAATLSKLFNKNVPKIRKMWQKETGGGILPSPLPKLTQLPAAGGTKEEMAESINELRESVKYVKEEIQRIRKEQSQDSIPVRTPQPSKKSGKKVEREMTYDEKHALSESINLLSEDHLNDLVRIIEKGMPNLNKNPDNSIVIELDLLDTATLRECEKFVKSVLTQKSAKKRKTLSGATKSYQSIQEIENKIKALNNVIQGKGGQPQDEEKDKPKDSSSSDSSSDSSSSG